MRLRPDPDQRAFADALDDLLRGSGVPTLARAWATGDHDPGLALWGRLAALGVSGLLVAEEHGGSGAGPVELVLAHEALGRHGVPGPWIEASAFLPRATDDTALLGRLAAGTVATVAVPPLAPYAVDAGAAEVVLRAADGTLHSVALDEEAASLDPTRRLHPVAGPDADDAGFPDAVDHAVLAAAAHLLGAGEQVLATSVGHVRQRHQFGRPVGSYQAVKHALADVRIALDFARPLVWGAALALAAGSPTAPRDVSAAKVAAGEAAALAARSGLQVHGAIGYTAECDLGLWLLRIRALRTAWGTPSWHRARVLAALATSEPHGDRWTVGA